jgi:glycosyltransferase involved in cell wall biosynthesis
VVCGLAFWGYSLLPGIKFYEKAVSEPAQEVKVSVIVPVYNAEKEVKRCLDSLRRQTLKEIEIIAVDDGSTDNSLAVLKKYAAFDKRIKVISQKNAYVGAARKRGLAEAQGEYVGFVDNDDFVSPNYYEKLYETAKANNADAVTSEHIVYRMGLIDYLEINKEYLVKKNEIIEDMPYYRANINGYLWDKIYRRSFLEKYGIPDQTFKTPSEDNYLTTLVLMHLDKLYVARGVTYYHVQKEDGQLFEHKRSRENLDAFLNMHAALVQKVTEADFDEETKGKWLEALQKVRAVCVYMELSRIENKPGAEEDFEKAYKERYPEDEVYFMSKLGKQDRENET